MLVGGIYRIVRLVGVGGMGEVWEARHERTKGRVALKLLLPEMGHHQEVLLRFQREVEITSGLNHPNIVRVSDADKLPDGRPYLIMEFLDGRDLTHVIGHPMAPAEVADIVEQTAMGLHAAHGQSIIHRDLKPANIFLVPLPGTPRSLVKILDFGISKAVDGLSKLTQTRTLMGTPYYMAPEQATGGSSSMDARSDQFSLATIAYELLTGRIAFEGDGIANVLYKVVNEAPPSFLSLGVAVGAGVEATVMRGLSKSAADRFDTILEFGAALKEAANSSAAKPEARVQRTSLLPTAPAAATTLRGSTGEMESVAGSGDSQDTLDVPTTARSSRRRAVGFIIGGAALAVAVLATFALHRSAASAKSSPMSGGPSMPVATPVARNPLPAFVPPAAREPPAEVAPVAPDRGNPAAPEPSEPAPSELIAPATPRRTTAKAASKISTRKHPSREHQAPVRTRKAATGISARHPGPLNEDL
jgi:serine/threonine protein kinase